MGGTLTFFLRTKKMGQKCIAALKELNIEAPSDSLKASHIDTLWQKYDKDSNGELNKEELKALCMDWLKTNDKSKVNSQRVEWALDKLLTAFDANDDGKISKDEFMKASSSEEKNNEISFVL